ncbi:acetamidase/formamidase family protein [Planococcus plakortidis]
MPDNAVDTLLVNRYVNGVLDPDKEMLGPVKDGGHIIAHTAPGCWGPMITPCIRGGHEVTQPVYVEGAEPGDAIVIRIKSVEVTSLATASGNDKPIEGRFLGDPFVAVKCPGCGTLYPETVIQGVGSGAIRCANCGEDVSPFEFTHGYTMAFSDKGDVGITVTEQAAETIAKDGKEYMKTPEHSVQNPVVTFAPHEYTSTQEELETHRTDGHMDISRVRAGAVLVCPVKVKGGGVYLGDMHAMQGDGEIAGHTSDVSGISHLQVHVLKGLGNAGPILFPNVEDLPYTAKPFTEAEKASAQKLAERFGVDTLEESLPVSFVGSGPTLNDATENGMQRAADLFGVTVPEIMNRATVTGSIEIGRHPGVVTVTFLAPESYLKKAGLFDLAKAQYG